MPSALPRASSRTCAAAGMRRYLRGRSGSTASRSMRRSVWVSRAELSQARTRAFRAEFLAAIDHAARNIRAVARRQKPQEWTIEVEPGVRAGQRVRAIESVGCYLPGGRFSLVSTLLMTVIPAQEAGVREIVVASPQPGAALLAAAERLGVQSRRASRRRAGNCRARLWDALDSARGQNIRPGQSLRHRGEAPGERRLRDRHACRADRGGRIRQRGQSAIHRRRFDRASRARSRRDFDIRHHFCARWPRRRRRNRPPAGRTSEDESRAAVAREKWRGAGREESRGCRRLRESLRAGAPESARRGERLARPTSTRPEAFFSAIGARKRLAIMRAARTTCCQPAAWRARAAAFPFRIS